VRVSLIRSIQLGVSALFSTRSSFREFPISPSERYYCTRAQQGSASVSAFADGRHQDHLTPLTPLRPGQMTRPETPNQIR